MLLQGLSRARHERSYPVIREGSYDDDGVQADRDAYTHARLAVEQPADAPPKFPETVEGRSEVIGYGLTTPLAALVGPGAPVRGELGGDLCMRCSHRP